MGETGLHTFLFTQNGNFILTSVEFPILRLNNICAADLQQDMCFLAEAVIVFIIVMWSYLGQTIRVSKYQGLKYQRELLEEIN